MYLIDKVVRKRGQDGRFGVDHSEVLNYELELANKDRDDHMNYLVYKNSNPYQLVSGSKDKKYIPPDDRQK